ncbi:MAG: hypothetical protein GY710_04455 [Desulfobacteraceae bacterium]|nr:hypothetical protein [Desulfobacteraceae bacterium]
MDKDLINAMHNSSLSSSFLGRVNVENKINQLVTKNIENFESIATGNLGLQISKQLIELNLIKRFYKGETIINFCNNHIKKSILCSKNVVADRKLLSVIFLNNLGLIVEDLSIFISEDFYQRHGSQISSDNIKKYYVDFRKERILFWQERLIKIEDEIKNFDDTFNEGEVLAYLLYLEGKGRL